MARVTSIKINKIALNKAVTSQRGIQSVALRRASIQAESIFENNKEQFIEDFNNHPVTQDIEQKPAQSQFVDDGNLFGFIGFIEGSEPTQVVRDAIEEQTELKLKSINPLIAGTTLTYIFDVKAPVLDELEALTPHPSPLPGSWLRGIERGISGLASYIYRLGAGRSQEGIQSQGKYRKSGGAYKPVKYYSEILNKFIRQISRKISSTRIGE